MEAIEDENKMAQSTVVLDQSPSSFQSNETFKNAGDDDENKQIRTYLLELTNYMVTEVCRRAAAASISESMTDGRGTIQAKKEHSSDVSERKMSTSSSSETQLSQRKDFAIHLKNSQHSSAEISAEQRP